MDQSSSHLTSREWHDHFRENLKEHRVDWQLPAVLDPIENRNLIGSLQAWQRGETSDGSHLLRAARKYAEQFDDPDYLHAISLFIQEEQKHGDNLGRYLDTIGAPRIDFDLGDWLFRRVRYFNSSIELWTISVIIVEMFAQLYYASLAKAANCPLLTDICKDILADESHHIRFQAERLQTIVKARCYPMRWLSTLLYRLLFYTVTLSVWIGHGCVFRQGGLQFLRYWHKSSRRFSRILARLAAAQTVTQTRNSASVTHCDDQTHAPEHAIGRKLESASSARAR